MRLVCRSWRQLVCQNLHTLTLRRDQDQAGQQRQGPCKLLASFPVLQELDLSIRAMQASRKEYQRIIRTLARLPHFHRLSLRVTDEHSLLPFQTESLGFLAPLSALPHLRSFGYTDGPDFVAHDIRAYFDTPPLQAATGLPKALALPGLTELRINHKAYSMVGGLRYVPYNLSAVMAMTSLRWLSVTWAQMQDLSVLHGCPLLEHLRLDRTINLTNISPVSALVNLRSLQVMRSYTRTYPFPELEVELEGMSALATLTQLTCLALVGAFRMTSQQPLSGLGNLRTLGLLPGDVDHRTVASLRCLTCLYLRRKPYLFLTSWCFAFNGLGMLRIVYVHKVYVEALQQQFSKLVVKAGGPALVLYGWWELGLPDLCPELDD